MSTTKRPVPLEHYIYTGNSNKTSDELFLLIDANEKYLTQGYTKAIDAKKNRSKVSNTNYGAKGTNQKATPQQVNQNFKNFSQINLFFCLKKEKNIWISLIGMLGKRELLPTVSFVFSRKRCDDNINMLSSMDLNTQAEKSEVHQFIQKSIMTLSKEDRHIPQVIFY
jgi:antiviral helicase SKI2